MAKEKAKIQNGGVSSLGGEPGTGETMKEETAFVSDIEVLAKPKRRRFTAEYKLRIVNEIDEAEPGQTGLILRREGLYSSHVHQWRQARDSGALRGLSKTRGRKPSSKKIQDQRIRKLEKELSRTKEKLRIARIIVDVQGKVCELLGIEPTKEKDC